MNEHGDMLNGDGTGDEVGGFEDGLNVLEPTAGVDSGEKGGHRRLA